MRKEDRKQLIEELKSDMLSGLRISAIVIGCFLFWLIVGTFLCHVLGGNEDAFAGLILFMFLFSVASIAIYGENLRALWEELWERIKRKNERKL